MFRHLMRQDRPPQLAANAMAFLSVIFSAFVGIIAASVAVAQPPPIPFSVDRPLTLDDSIAPLRRRDLRPLTSASCASAACHGGERPGVTDPFQPRGAEYPLWLEHDPHAQARSTLCSAKSITMLTSLRILHDGQIVDLAGYRNCLACHDPNALASSPDGDDGVGCASCHGPAERWVGSHYRFAECSHDLTSVGWVSLDDLLVRARVCASCHVGDSDRDMNHDIMAAGHPPLRYEFATYHARLPKHWRVEPTSERFHFESQLWLAGQIAGLDASLALLESRAAERNVVSAWPELSEYECASCHHQPNRLVGSVAGNRRSKGSVATYSPWNRTGLTLWLDAHDTRPFRGDTATDRELIAALDAVRQLMESTASPEPRDAVDAARSARLALNRWIHSLGQLDLTTIDAERLSRVLHEQANHPWITSSWESAVQFYLAAVATRTAWPDGNEGTVAVAAERTRQLLAYPPRRDLNTFPLGYSAPDDAASAELVESLKKLGDALTPDRNNRLECGELQESPHGD